ncbi:MAG TPA: M28 family peptidase, partial [Gemmatimonadaceae bacterium]
MIHKSWRAAVLIAGVALNAGAQQSATRPAITQADLRRRLSIFADDSMLGRSALNPGHERAVRYLASELKRLGLKPMGENGTYFQTFYILERRANRASTIQVGDSTLRPGVDFKALAFGRGQPRPIQSAPIVFGGIVGDSTTQISADSAAGKVVLLGVPATMNANRAYANVIYGPRSRFARALAVAIASFDFLPPNQRGITSQVGMADTSEEAANTHPITILVSRRAADLMLASDVAMAKAGVQGQRMTSRISVDETRHPVRNVIAVIPGADPVLRNEYVALGAHSDHLGTSVRPLEHDSVRAVAIERRRRLIGLSSGSGPISANVDSLRRVRPPRVDSIFNGADDDGSGSVALLEIAERFATAPLKPKRSLLFAWHAAEEMGLVGSTWLSEHPVIPLDSIVAQLNMDMIGRGNAGDVPNGGPTILGVIGASVRSPALAKLVDDTNRTLAMPFQLVTRDQENAFCRSDHWNYARFGIPVAFFTTGEHADYHQVTDEAQYVDYEKLERVTRFVA